MAERAKLFLTEGEKLRPHKKSKPVRNHPWRAPVKAKTLHHYPAHITGVDDESSVMGDVSMASGCYITRNNS